jgi:methylmalonyl-CoA/ethylmalonyl-CoA epimerase
MDIENELTEKLQLPPPSQICVVVHDLKTTAKLYQQFMGLDKFVFPEIHYDNIEYRGQPSQGYWEMAFARMGPLELELAHPIKSPTIYEDFLNQHGQGLHHLGYDIQNLDESIERAKSLGLDVLMSGRTSKGGFAHLDTEKHLGTIVELIQRPASRV